MELAQFYAALGVLFLAGLAADQVGRLTRLPRVTMLLLLGLGFGNAGLDLIPETVAAWFEGLSVIALTMVAFLLGGSLTRSNLVRHGRAILSISLSVVIVTIAAVAIGLALAGLDTGLALLLGAIATATAPAAITDVIRQSGIENSFTETLKGIVAIDDAWGLIAFSVIAVLVSQSDGWGGVLSGTALELGGSVLLGLAIGFPAALLTGRLSPGEPLQAEAIGLVFLTAGLSIWLDLSFLVTGMTVGAIIANVARHHTRAFHEIEHIQWPFMILFFLLAGASLDLETLLDLGVVGLLYVLLRIAARMIGGFIGARIGGTTREMRPLFGPALLPQAGVAVGMALVAAETFPEWGPTIMAFTIASTVAFELIGPPITLAVLRRTAQTQG